jgi:hypothetical protein
MYVIALHQIQNPETAFPRGRKLMAGEGAPPGVRVLQFLPSRTADHVTCLWEGPSVDAVQNYVIATLGDSSNNSFYQVDSGQAFAERPLGLPVEPVLAS